jgi:hypothetical protein
VEAAVRHSECRTEALNLVNPLLSNAGCLRLAIPLQAVAEIVQKLPDEPVAGPMSTSHQLSSQQSGALAGPSQRRLRISVLREIPVARATSAIPP